MSDINRGSINGDLIERDAVLRKQYKQVLLNEKLNQVKQLDVHLDQLKTVQIKQIEFKKELLLREIEELTREINAIQL